MQNSVSSLNFRSETSAPELKITQPQRETSNTKNVLLRTPDTDTYDHSDRKKKTILAVLGTAVSAALVIAGVCYYKGKPAAGEKSNGFFDRIKTGWSKMVGKSDKAKNSDSPTPADNAAENPGNSGGGPSDSGTGSEESKISKLGFFSKAKIYTKHISRKMKETFNTNVKKHEPAEGAAESGEAAVSGGTEASAEKTGLLKKIKNHVRNLFKKDKKPETAVTPEVTPAAEGAPLSEEV